LAQTKQIGVLGRVFCLGVRWPFDVCQYLFSDEEPTYPDAAGRPGIDNNAYTNVMAAWTLWRALELLDRLQPACREDCAAACASSRRNCPFGIIDLISAQEPGLSRIGKKNSVAAV
jgi:hypothetical protein